MTKAAAHLTPVTLELGGKSPCIVDETADLTVAARRIVFGKFLNCGQTCVAPDYVLVSRSVKEKFLSEISREIGRMYGPDPLQNSRLRKDHKPKTLYNVCSPCWTGRRWLWGAAATRSGCASPPRCWTG